MSNAQFIFTKYPNSVSVHVENLEELRVEQIQEIEEFVRIRNGIFDFETYTFVIQKKIEFYEFVSLLEHAGIKADCVEKTLKITNNAKIEFGQYKGMLYSEIPDSYLLWLKKNYRGKDREVLDLELTNRGL